MVRHRGAKPFLTTAGRRHLHHTVEQRMQFGCPLPGAAGDHVDLTDALVIQQEHRLLLLKKWQKHDYDDDDDNAGGLLLFNSFDCILTFPSQQKRGHGFFRLMLDDNTTSSCRSMFRRRHWLFLLHSASRELLGGSSLRMQRGAKMCICGGVNNRSALSDKPGEFPLNTPLYHYVLNKTRCVLNVKIRSNSAVSSAVYTYKKKKNIQRNHVLSRLVSISSAPI